MWIFTLSTKTRWYEVWKVLDIFADLLLLLSSLSWEHLGLSLSGLCDLNLALQLACCWEHMVNLHLDIQLSCCLDWHLIANLAHGKYLCLGFHLAHWLAWWLALDKDIWLDYHWDFHLDPHLTIQILALVCLERWWERLLGHGLDMAWSWGRYLLRPSLWSFHHI